MEKKIDEDIEKYEKSMLLLVDVHVISIPKNVEKLLRSLKYKKELLEIDKDKKKAIELCLVFLSNFANIQSDYNNHDKWKPLATDILKEQIKGLNGTLYLKVINFLLKPIFPSVAIIEVKKNAKGSDTYQVGTKSKQFRLINEFSEVDFVKYAIKNDTLIAQRREQRTKNLNVSLVNPIIRNLLTVYPKLTLPTLQEIEVEAKKLSKENYITSKGMILTFMHGRKKSSFLNFQDRRVSHVDALKSYKNLTDNGLLVPVVSGERGGHRVCDSFNMMPSFIRNLIKIDNEDVVVLDFKCFHPNLCVKLYGGSAKRLTHQEVAKDLNINIKEVKKEHLSFFNKSETLMKLSPLYGYYEKKEPKMLYNLLEEKRRCGYKETSKRLLNLEVEIITECIERLNKQEIYPLYIFDALLVKSSNEETTKSVMNEVVKEMGIYTTV